MGVLKRTPNSTEALLALCEKYRREQVVIKARLLKPA
jgi:hypothetical protein